MRPPSAAQSRAGAVAPTPRGFPVVACPDSIARDTRCLLLTHTTIKGSAEALLPDLAEHEFDILFLDYTTDPDFERLVVLESRGVLVGASRDRDSIGQANKGDHAPDVT